MAYPLLESPLADVYSLDGDYISSDSEQASELRLPTDDVTYYETVRVKKGILLFLEEHLARLQRSVAGIEAFDVDMEMIERKAYSYLNDNGFEDLDGNLRIVLTKNHLLIYVCEGNIPSEEAFSRGVDTMTLKWERVDPNIKVYRGDYKKAVADTFAKENEFGHPYEILLTDNEGRLYEGSKSNLFVIKGDKVYSAPDDKILLGITRKRVLSSLDLAGGKLETGMLTKEEILSSKECAVFVSSTPFDILPIRSIDGKVIDSADNELLQRIASCYRKMSDDYIDNKLKEVR